MEKVLEKVMKMIESGVITSIEGQQLIQAIDKAHNKVSEVKKKMTGRFLHIDIDSYENKQVIAINIPVKFTKSLLGMAFIQKQLKSQAEIDVEFDLHELIDLINHNYKGDLMMMECNSANIRVWVD